jgi:putative transposase
LKGLKDKSRSGRPPSLVNNNLMIKIRKELEDSNTGWDFKQVMNVIQKKTGIKYHEVHIYRLLHKWGFSARILERIRKNSIQRREKEI